MTNTAPLRTSVLWLLPLIFLIHDGEEALTMPVWIREHRDLLNRLSDMTPLHRRLISQLPATSAGILTGIAFEMLIILAATVAFVRILKRNSRLRMPVYVYSIALGAYVVHVAAHILQPAALGMYTPGVVSGVLVVLPVGGYIYWRLIRTGWLTAQEAALTAVAGALAILPVLLIAFLVGRSLAG